MRALEKMGYTNVKEYRGGKKEWIAKGLPTESFEKKVTESIRYLLGAA